ncbi:PREDICTED: uncharacterized protein LOC108612684 isoform X2 [Drosophila arizonae]|uniref:Uncharacterized protein LOC108612684 isoform X2 n=1 Tax=Drosophila arizonae TaxID=7263 RepID=A0ABM1P1P8_DROAR|nr:PREDICTED: uncharacterized protein LOC108612684 isoform X2 [Drosophila arizonae]
MFGASFLFVALCAAASLDASEAARLRFPGPVLQRQEAAPYPPAGLTPDPPFELPTEQPADFPQPDLTYGPPEEQPELVYGPPEEQPELVYGPPDDTYGPPELPTNVDANGSGQSAATISLASLRPQLQFVLPLVQRFTAFRQMLRPVQSNRRPSKLTARPQKRPAKIINRVNAAFPATQLTLPFVERRIPFRPARLIVNAPLKRKPAKITVNSPKAPLAQLTPAIRRPIFSGGRIIAYSDQVQNW